MEERVQQDIDSLMRKITEIEKKEDERSKSLLLCYHEQMTWLRRLQLEVFLMKKGNYLCKNKIIFYFKND